MFQEIPANNCDNTYFRFFCRKKSEDKNPWNKNFPYDAMHIYWWYSSIIIQILDLFNKHFCNVKINESWPIHSDHSIYLYSLVLLFLFLNCISFHFNSMHFMLNTVWFASHQMYLIICILCISFNSFHFFASHYL